MSEEVDTMKTRHLMQKFALD